MNSHKIQKMRRKTKSMRQNQWVKRFREGNAEDSSADAGEKKQNHTVTMGSRSRTPRISSTGNNARRRCDRGIHDAITIVRGKIQKYHQRKKTVYDSKTRGDGSVVATGFPPPKPRAKFKKRKETIRSLQTIPYNQLKKEKKKAKELNTHFWGTGCFNMSVSPCSSLPL